MNYMCSCEAKSDAEVPVASWFSKVSPSGESDSKGASAWLLLPPWCALLLLETGMFQSTRNLNKKATHKTVC